MHLIRAISIKQPFVELILQGKKKDEFRTIPTKIRERVYLYASSKPRTEPKLWRRAKRKIGDLPCGLIVGSVEIMECKYLGKGKYAYVLRNPRRLRKYLMAKNRASPVFWRPKF